MARETLQITVFVNNIPASMHWKGLWTLFNFHGVVKDAFILNKKSKVGSRFGFVRFSCVTDAQRAIERLNGFVILGYRIGVKMASFKGRKIWRKKNTHAISITTVSDTRSMAERLSKFGLEEISVKRIQGRFFLIEVPDNEFMEVLKQKDWAYLKECFIKIEPWLEKRFLSKRVAWIDVAVRGQPEEEEGQTPEVESRTRTESEQFSKVRRNDVGGALTINLEECEIEKDSMGLSIEGILSEENLIGNKELISVGDVDNDKELVRAKEDMLNMGLLIQVDPKKGLGQQKSVDLRVGVLSTKEKQKRDRNEKLEKGKAITRFEETIANISLSDSDISNCRRVTLREAKRTWEVGKKLGFSMRGDEEEEIDEIRRLKGQEA
ncbi:hypothetical protein GOBAR_AA18256 [Gossypium barbadense]|uniref:RRM domain-containing protein n=1 Tax=Gossypium barbadense TaxID=3634 RepID=A0A2P5XGE1_GOSBA|nr:hypothetical protein GOBAR_AA18256 [Gossypium barbadense]